MIPATRQTLFLARRSYRQRRLRDAARMLPVLGVVLWLIPLMRQADDGLTDATGTGQVLIHVFGVWALLIGLAALVALRLQPGDDAADGAGDRGDGHL